MAKLPAPYKCDRCPSIRSKDSNHWWLILAEPESITVYPWDAKAAEEPGVKHLCGQPCVIQELNAFMQAPTGTDPRGVQSQ